MYFCPSAVAALFSFFLFLFFFYFSPSAVVALFSFFFYFFYFCPSGVVALFSFFLFLLFLSFCRCGVHTPPQGTHVQIECTRGGESEGERATGRGRDRDRVKQENRYSRRAGGRGYTYGSGAEEGGASGDTCIIAPTATTNYIGIRNLEVGIRDSRVTRGPRPRLHYRLLTICCAAY